MAALMFDYAAYHRTIIGYHGTTVGIANELVDGKPFHDSNQDDEWFGKGIYFWEYAPKQAWRWANSLKKHTESAVVGAIIQLGNCFDLLDPRNIPLLKEYHRLLRTKLSEAGASIPRNVRSHRKLDCAVFNYLYGMSDEGPNPIQSARSVFVPRSNVKRVREGSWIYDEAHIQICVREPRNILAVWHVRRDGRYGKEGN